jgi:hypothetical protein
MANQPTPHDDERCPYCPTDLHPGDHAHEEQVDLREVRTTVAAVARGEGPLVLAR